MEPTISRIAIYARVSTLNGQNPELQLSEIREYAARRGLEVFGEYVDLGVSGVEGIAAGTQSDDEGCASAQVRCGRVLETRPPRTQPEAPSDHD